jgi:hypothetical protein
MKIHAMDNPQKSLDPNTTRQEDITTAGQRRINLIWEITQAVIAVSITWAVIYTVIIKVENYILTNAFFLIVSIYFVRTNHNLIGGVGIKKGSR